MGHRQCRLCGACAAPACAWRGARELRGPRRRRRSSAERTRALVSRDAGTGTQLPHHRHAVRPGHLATLTARRLRRAPPRHCRPLQPGFCRNYLAGTSGVISPASHEHTSGTSIRCKSILARWVRPAPRRWTNYGRRRQYAGAVHSDSPAALVPEHLWIGPGKCPVAENFYRHALSLPLYRP